MKIRACIFRRHTRLQHITGETLSTPSNSAANSGQNCLMVNRKKCEFGRCEIAYLGHVVYEKGVAIDPDKVKAIMKWPQPSNLKELRGFLGLTGYYKKICIQICTYCTTTN